MIMKMAIVLFDGECNFCDASVQFILKHDPKGIFKFASLKSEIGQQLLNDFNVPQNMDGIVLIEGNGFYTRSTAALKIARQLTGLWKFFYTFIIIPKFLRDSVYSVIAKNRYKWFGKKDSCMLPTPEQRKRFL